VTPQELRIIARELRKGLSDLASDLEERAEYLQRQGIPLLSEDRYHVNYNHGFGFVRLAIVAQALAWAPSPPGDTRWNDV
jgi:hypothetical protein